MSGLALSCHVPSSTRRQFALQVAALLLVMSIAWPLHLFTATALNWQVTSLAIGGTAFAIAVATRQAWWWCLIHLAFSPLAWAVAQAGIEPGFFLIGFMLLLLVYRGALSGQVPLYLSGDEALESLAQMIEGRHVRSFLDLGAGVGSIVAPLARRFPEVRFSGVENAAIPWLIGWIRTRGLANCSWRYGDLWSAELQATDLVYAFLSPAPMARLGARATAEMRPGSVLVSNSFEIPGRAPSFVAMAGDWALYGYEA